MEKTGFMDEESVYYIEHNGIPGAGVMLVHNPDNLQISDLAGSWVIDDTYEMVHESDNSVAYLNEEADSNFIIEVLNLSHANRIFPKTLRTYPTLNHLEKTIRRELSMVDSYTPDTGVEETLSFTLDDDGNVLELIRVTEEEGEMFYRENEGWVHMNAEEEYPTIFDQQLIDIAETDIDTAILVWDASQTKDAELTKDDILPFAALTQ